MKSFLILYEVFLFTTALFYLADGLPLLEHYLICPDIACKLCPPGEVPDFDARGCWSSCECIPATNTYSLCGSTICPAHQRCENNFITRKKSCVDNCFKECPDFYKPVCGSDMKTYNNECELKVRSCLIGGNLSKIADGVCYSLKSTE